MKGKSGVNEYVFESDLCIGKIRDGVFFICDFEDYEKIKKYKWCYNSSSQCVYAKDKGNSKKHVKIYQIIWGQYDSKLFVIDHVNRNVLDNRKINLRIATKSQNGMNSSLSKANKSGVKGVFITKQNSFTAYITVNQNRIPLGTYKKIEDAIEARRIAEEKYFKEFSSKTVICEVYDVSMLSSP